MGSQNYPRYMQRQWLRVNQHEAYILLMAQGGRNDDEIAAELDVRPRYVTKLRLSASAPKADTFGSSLWTPEADQTILQMRDREGRQFIRIAEALKRDPREIVNRYNYLINHRERRERSARRGQRPCMTCREVFISEDLSRNRRCEACKKLDLGVPDQLISVSSGLRYRPGATM